MLSFVWVIDLYILSADYGDFVVLVSLESSNDPGPNRNQQFLAWPRGYKTFFMLNSAEYEICPANKYQIAYNC